MAILTYSQNEYPKVIVMDNDTLVLFSKDQVKQLAKTKIEYKMYKEFSDSCLINSSIIEKKVGIQQEMIKILEQKNDNNEIIILNYNKMLSNSEKMNQDKDKIIKRQKIKTSVAIGVAILTTIIALWR